MALTFLATGKAGLAPSATLPGAPSQIGLPDSGVYSGTWRFVGNNGQGQPTYTSAITCNAGTISETHYVSVALPFGSETWTNTAEEVASPGYYIFGGGDGPHVHQEVITLTSNLTVYPAYATSGFGATWLFCQAAGNAYTVSPGGDVYGMPAFTPAAGTCTSVPVHFFALPSRPGFYVDGAANQ